MSVSKLCKDSKCLAVFSEDICLLQDCDTKPVKGLGECRDGLYYLVNTPLEKISPDLLNRGHKLLSELRELQRSERLFAGIASKHVDSALWHKRLGHASFSKLKHVKGISVSENCKDIC